MASDKASQRVKKFQLAPANAECFFCAAKVCRDARDLLEWSVGGAVDSRSTAEARGECATVVASG